MAVNGGLILNRIRRRTIKALTAQGICHELALIPTTTLFDKAELRLECPTRKQRKFVREYFATPRHYMVRVSKYGSAGVSITNSDVIVLPAKDVKNVD
jgi:hypothetical protein